MLELILLMQAAVADPQVLARGEKLFAQSCSVGYCHGVAGAAARGPRLAGRTFTLEYLVEVTRDGIPRSAMPGWKGRMSEADIHAVVEYVASLGTVTGDAGPAAAPAGETEDLTHERNRFLESCGICHAGRGVGKAVGPELSGRTEAEIRAGLVARRPALVKRLELASGESFPAVTGSDDGDWVQVFDLSVAPPVLLTLPRSEIRQWKDHNEWQHPQPAHDAPLASIARYLSAR